MRRRGGHAPTPEDQADPHRRSGRIVPRVRLRPVCVFSLHFHHVDPATKSFAVTTARGKSLAAFREEAKKCVLVCANCHGEIESGLIESPPPYYAGTPD